MKRVKLFLLFLLIIAAGLSAYIAMKPLVYSVQKTQQMKKDSQTFYEEAEVIQKEAEEQHIPIPPTRICSWRCGNITGSCTPHGRSV